MNDQIANKASRVVNIMREGHYYPASYIVDEIKNDGSIVRIKDRNQDLIQMASNTYLGKLSSHPKVIEAVEGALRRFGLGSGGSPVTCGHTTAHVQLEEKLAEFKGTEAAVLFPTGTTANIGIIYAIAGCQLEGVVGHLDRSARTELFGKPITILFDRLSHRSIIAGIEMVTSKIIPHGTPVEAKPFRHRDMADLEEQLESVPAENTIIVVTDGVFSLHGRIAPLDEMAALCVKHGATLYTDDAHSTGIFGKYGRGTCEHFGVEKEVILKMGTFSKALDGAGGFLASSKDICDYVRAAAPTYLFGTSMPPSTAAGLTAILDLLKDEPWRREQLLANADWVARELERMGYDVFDTKTQIIPVRFYQVDRAKEAADTLLSNGVFAPAYYYPAVGRDEAMVRLNLMATHTQHQLEKTLHILEKIKPSSGIVRDKVRAA